MAMTVGCTLVRCTGGAVARWVSHRTVHPACEDERVCFLPPARPSIQSLHAIASAKVQHDLLLRAF